jgi:cytochrome oxidase Cu insertion factor (SCO1/SenC/PrrC family)
VHNLRAMGTSAAIRMSVVSALVIALLLGASARIARADGDPASDYLISNQVFLTSESGTPSSAQRQLVAVIRAANRAGFAIRVAVIATAYDLGSITPLWRRPGLYARFLGQELESAYRQRLLVVMPNGFGFNWPGHSAAAADRELAAVSRSASDVQLAEPAQAAVRRLAAASGVVLPSTPLASEATAGGGSGSDTGVILGTAGATIAVLAAIAGVALRRARRRTRPPAPTSRRTGDARGLPVGLRWAIPGGVLLCGAAVAVPVLALHRNGGVSSAQSASVVTPPPFSWPAGRRAAPDFVLRDQADRPISVAAYLGRPVIVTFIDPLCRNLCPLEAQVLNQTERQLPASQRPVIIAVSVDVYASSRADLLQDVREWHLVPQWRWAVGRPSALAAVWKRYEIGVSVVTKRIARTTIHYITHTEGAYIIDRSGHERALFLWPFYPQDVKRALRRLA